MKKNINLILFCPIFLLSINSLFSEDPQIEFVTEMKATEPIKLPLPSQPSDTVEASTTLPPLPPPSETPTTLPTLPPPEEEAPPTTAPPETTVAPAAPPPTAPPPPQAFHPTREMPPEIAAQMAKRAAQQKPPATDEIKGKAPVDKYSYSAIIFALQTELNKINEQTTQTEKNSFIEKLSKLVKGISIMNKSELQELIRFFDQAYNHPNLLIQTEKIEQKTIMEQWLNEARKLEAIATEKVPLLSEKIAAFLKETDILKKINIYDQLLAHFYNLKKSKLDFLTIKTGTSKPKLIAIMQSLIRNVRNYATAQINALINLLKKIKADKNAPIVFSQSWIDSIERKIIPNLDMILTLKQITPQSSFTTKVQTYEQALAKLIKEIQLYERNMMLNGIKLLTKRTDLSDAERAALNRLLATLAKKANSFSAQQQKFIEGLTKNIVSQTQTTPTITEIPTA